MPEVTVNDVNLYYEIYGEGEPLVFIPGFAADHLIFSEMPKHYENKYQVVLLDNRGSGQSDCPDEPYTIDMMADDVIGLCRVLELGPCHFVGHSMGGMILQKLAHDHPDQVRSAVLCCTDVAIDIRYALAAKSRLAFMAAGCSPMALIENGLGWVFSAAFLERPGMIENIISMRLTNPFPITEEGYKNQLNALLSFNSHAWIKQIQAQCLVISGEQDIITPDSSAQKMAALIPNAQYQCIPQAGHIPFMEQPAIFHKTLQKHLLKFSK